MALLGRSSEASTPAELGSINAPKFISFSNGRTLFSSPRRCCVSLETELPVRRPLWGVQKGGKCVDPFPPPAVTGSRIIAGAISMQCGRGARSIQQVTDVMWGHAWDPSWDKEGHVRWLA